MGILLNSLQAADCEGICNPKVSEGVTMQKNDSPHSFPDLSAMPLISVFGGRDVPQDILQAAEAFGAIAAQQGWIILNGGKNGVMEAVSKGVRDAGGLSIGILPGEDYSEANPYLQVALRTGIGLARNEILARAAHVCVAIGGHYGTLSEIAYALNYGTPVISLRSWGIEGVIPASNAEDAAAKVKAALP